MSKQTLLDWLKLNPNTKKILIVILLAFSVTGCNQQVNYDITPVHLDPEYNWVTTLVDDIWLYDLDLTYEDEVELLIWAESYYDGEYIEKKFSFKFHLDTAFNGRLILSVTRLEYSISENKYLWKASIVDQSGFRNASQVTNIDLIKGMGMTSTGRPIQDLVMEQSGILTYHVSTQKSSLPALPEDPTLEEIIGHAELVNIVFISVKPFDYDTSVD